MLISKNAIITILQKIFDVSKKVDTHTHNNATSTSGGFMSSNDKSKLDGIASGANKITVYTANDCTTFTADEGTCTPAAVKKACTQTFVDRSLSTTSTNSVQNKVIKAALDGKQPIGNYAASSHTHNYLPLSGGTMTGEITFGNTLGLYGKDTSGTSQRIAVVSSDNCCYLGGTAIHTYIRSSDCPQYLNAAGTKYNLWHAGNLNPSNYLSLSGGTLTGGLNGTAASFSAQFTPSAGLDKSLSAGRSKLYGNALTMSNPGTSNDTGWIRILGSTEADTVLEIATGDDGGVGEQIVCRQYNTSNTVVHQLILLDKSGNTTTNASMKASSFVVNSGCTLSYDSTNKCLNFVFA